MKKRTHFLSFLLIFLGLFFVSNIEVSAAGTKIGTCTYTPSHMTTPVKGIKLKVTLYKDGTTDRTISLGDWSLTNDKLKNGVYISDTPTFLSFKNAIFDKNGDFFKAYQKNKNCPTLQFRHSENTYQLFIYVILNGRSEDPNGDPTDTLTPNMTEVNPNSGEKIEGEKKGCMYNAVPLKALNQNESVKVEFYEQGGTKYFKVTRKGESYQGTASGIASDGEMMYSINPADVDKLYTSPCPIDRIYAKAILGDSKNVMFQIEQPPVEEDASYDPVRAKHNKGFPSTDAPDQSIDLSNFNQPQTCEGIFGVSADGEFVEESLGWIIQKLLNYIKIAGPILVLLFSMFEFAKAIVSSDDDAMKKAQSRLVVRVIAMLALFLLPFLVGEALKLINGLSNPTCFFK